MGSWRRLARGQLCHGRRRGASLAAETTVVQMLVAAAGPPALVRKRLMLQGPLAVCRPLGLHTAAAALQFAFTLNRDRRRFVEAACDRRRQRLDRIRIDARLVPRAADRDVV